MHSLIKKILFIKYLNLKNNHAINPHISFMDDQENITKIIVKIIF
jgi:hypothetical protein